MLQTKPHDYVFTVLLSVLLLATVVLFIGGDLSTIDGASMLPALRDGDRVWSERVSYLLGGPRRGDIVLIAARRGNGFVKRVIGLPGEVVEIRRGQVLIGGLPLDEPYLPRLDMEDFPPVAVPPGSYFVLGDNRPYSEDSRGLLGFVPRRAIRQRVAVRFWPRGSFRFFARVQYGSVVASDPPI